MWSRCAGDALASYVIPMNMKLPSLLASLSLFGLALVAMAPAATAHCTVNFGYCASGGTCDVNMGSCYNYGDCELNLGGGACNGGDCTVNYGGTCKGWCDVNLGTCDVYGFCPINVGYCNAFLYGLLS